MGRGSCKSVQEGKEGWVGFCLGGVKAGEGRAQDLQVVPLLPQAVVQLVVVGVGVVPVPVQDVVAHVQGVARQVGRRVPQAVELVPQQPPLPAMPDTRILHEWTVS